MNHSFFNFKLTSISLLILALSGQSALAQGGSGAGNGGKGVYCKIKSQTAKKTQPKSNSEASVSVLDFWEARKELIEDQISLGDSSLDEYQKVELMLNRIQSFDPRFAQELRNRFEQYKLLFILLPRVKISEIDDTKQIIAPNGLLNPQSSKEAECYTIQIAVQKRVIDPFFKKKFLIDQDYYERMNTTERAGLIFHEILYWAEIERGAQDSFGVRRVTAAIALKDFSLARLSDYLNLVRLHLKKNTYDYHGTEILLDDSTLFHHDGSIAQANSASSGETFIPVLYSKVSAQFTLGYPAKTVLRFIHQKPSLIEMSLKSLKLTHDSQNIEVLFTENLKLTSAAPNLSELLQKASAMSGTVTLQTALGPQRFTVSRVQLNAEGEVQSFESTELHTKLATLDDSIKFKPHSMRLTAVGVKSDDGFKAKELYFTQDLSVTSDATHSRPGVTLIDPTTGANIWHELTWKGVGPYVFDLETRKFK